MKKRNSQFLKNLLGIGLILFTTTYSSDYSLEDLEVFKAQNLITEEEYEILKAEIEGTSSLNDEMLYSVLINGRVRSNNLKLLKKDGADYIPLMEFLNIIRFKNYELEKNGISMKVGKELNNIDIDWTKHTVILNNPNRKIEFNETQIIKEDNEIYLEVELFKSIFTNSLEIDTKKLTFKTQLTFITPIEIDISLDNKLDNEQRKESKNEFVYTNENKLFDVGYMRVNVQGELSKNKGENYETGWTGDLEYQGNLLYGEFTTAYDLKDETIGDTYFYYPEIYKNHSLEFGSYGTTQRELGLSLRKEKGYFYQGKNIVIRENVPIGSRVELLYLGFPIAVQYAENGIVEFENEEIKSDREYTLRVYDPSGKIYTIDINTAVDFRQQNKGELEYDFRVREDHDTGKYSSEGNIYYGLTENLTLGTGYIRSIETSDNKVEYLDIFNAEAVYSNSIYRMPYTLVLGTEKAKDKRTKEYLETQIQVNNFKFITEHQNFGLYYDLETVRTYTVEYNSNNGYLIDVNYYINDYYEEKTEKNYDAGVSIYKNLMRDLLVTTEYRKGNNQNDQYSLNLYYTGLHYLNTRLNNRWSENGKDYESVLTLMNKNIWDTFDFSIEFSYSNRDESKFTFRFDLNYDNWFRAGMFAGKNGQQNYRLGVDKVVDLKNITRNIESMDSSRVKVTAFIDENGNDIYDKGEKLVDNVEIKIGSQTEVTTEEGEAYFFGVPNGVLYNLNPKVRKPSYSLGNNKIAVRGTNTGTIEAYIPLKAMVTLSGIFVVDDKLNLSENDIKEIYDNIIIKIKDENGKVLENTIPDETGVFYVSELFTGSYNIEINYYGDKLDIPPLKQKIDLKYIEDKDNEIVLEFKEKGIILLKN
ncbi:hypothetical protein [Candidatus Cetobacterium colombiensis]|uniref:SD-repeat containing protein B domain-containing protein n=1 Tax=Candidatus Cetobacterium colombiensis TaxID=3073100 RepID=A0ABU4W6P5_9FUSO|nr:hypothetical protein [Candidatus Cetobacterium colombiensis]MDX8335203.1 hypothetical protein [Candidatus Cetobacterium colombiensis]